MATTDGAPEAAGGFGALLRHFRERAGLGQEQLAKRAGVSAAAISNLERGVNRPRLETVQLLAQALGLSDAEQSTLLSSARPDPLPPITLPSHPHNLPVLPTPLLGREDVVATVLARLQEPETRLLTLTGVGGIGKTRLALAVAQAAQDAFPAGVWLVELAPLSDPALVAGAIAQTLGVRESNDRILRDALVAYLRPRLALVVLDNCEHLLPAAPLVAELVAACPSLRVLATSRAALHLRGEQQYPVPPLAMPEVPADPSTREMLDRLAGVASVTLFVQRAQAVQPHFQLTPHNAAAVAAICRRLEGLPLAIELAASRIKVLPPAVLLRRLDPLLPVLTGGARDAPERHQTMRAAIAWSYDLLAASEQALLRRLAVYAGGGPLEAVEVVCQDDHDPMGNLLDRLDALVDQSLVQVTTDETGAQPRVSMLETVREYALEQLTAAGEEALVRGRHLAWCVALAECAEPELTGPEQGAWLDRLEAEHDNLRAALRWAHDRGASEQGLRLAAALWRFWDRRGYIAEGREWLEAALAASGPAAPALRARALTGAGNLAQRQGADERAVALHEEALALGRASGDTRSNAAALNGLGRGAQERGDQEQARRLHEEALALWRTLGDQWGVAFSLNSLGNVAWRQGDYGAARALHETSLALRRDLGDTAGVAASLGSLAIVALQQGDNAYAGALHEEALALHRALGDQRGIAVSLANLGWGAYAQGDYVRAEVLCMESVALRRMLGDRWGLAATLDTLGRVASGQGDDERAQTLHEEALALWRALGDTWGIAVALNRLGAVALRQGEGERAAIVLREALVLSHDSGARELVAESLESLARLAVSRGQALQAARLGGAAEALREALGAPLPPDQRADHAAVVQAVRAAVGAEQCAAAWAAGHALPLDETIALALRDIADP